MVMIEFIKKSLGFKSKIGRKMLFYILLFSSFITFLGTGLQLYLDFDHDIDSLHLTLTQIESSYLDGIANSLWVTDDELLRIQLEGIFKLPDMQFIEVRNKAKVVGSVGLQQSDKTIKRSYPLMYAYNGKDIDLGDLLVVASLKNIYARIFDRILVILFIQTIKTFLVSLFIFILFYQLVGRHIISMASSVESIKFDAMDDVKISFEKSISRKPDELDQLADSFNEMINSLSVATNNLKDSEEKFRALVTNTEEIIFMIDKDGRFLLSQGKGLCALGLEPDEVVGESVFELYKGSPDMLAAMEQAFEGESVTTEVNIGSIYFRSWFTPHKNQEDEIIGLLGMSVNITEQKESEKELKQKSGFLDKIIESAALSTWISDEAGTAIRANPACLEFFGATEDEVIGKYNLFKDTAIENNGFMPDIQRVFEKGESANIIIDYDFTSVDHVDVKNATHKIINSILTPIKDASGNVTNAIVQAIDLTEIKKMEEDLIQSRKMESIGSLAGGIAHEFNNILSIIIGNNELVMEDLPEWSVTRENAEEIRIAGMRARDVVKQLLTFSRQDHAVKKVIDFKSVISGSMKLIRSSTPTNIEIQLKLSDDTCPVVGNDTQINQVLINLSNNAVDAMPTRGGLLVVELSNETVGKKQTKYPAKLTSGRYVKLVVSDNGMGMDKETLDRIFDPYFTTKDIGKGSGIGLAVVHGIIEKHGGSIIAESDPKGGAKFTMFFPAYEGLFEQETDEKISLPTGKECILYVDDEPSIAKLGKHHLESLDYTVESTTDPLEALDMIKTDIDKYDLVISDMAMPNMTGDQLVKNVLKLCPDMPTIICTGYSANFSQKEAMEIGVGAFAMKPLDKTELAITVRKVLDDSKRPE